MTKRETTYLERLKARRSVLAARLVFVDESSLPRCDKSHKRLVRELRAEFRAIKWAIEMIERVCV